MYQRANDKQGAADQLGYMARAAALAEFPSRATTLGGLAWRSFRGLRDLHGQALTTSALHAAAVATGNQKVAKLAAVIAWGLAKQLDPNRAAQLEPIVASVFVPEKLDAGLSSEEFAAVEQALDAAIEDVLQQLLATGEDPVGPLVQ